MFNVDDIGFMNAHKSHILQYRLIFMNGFWGAYQGSVGKIKIGVITAGFTIDDIADVYYLESFHGGYAKFQFSLSALLRDVMK